MTFTNTLYTILYCNDVNRTIEKERRAAVEEAEQARSEVEASRREAESTSSLAEGGDYLKEIETLTKNYERTKLDLEGDFTNDLVFF